MKQRGLALIEVLIVAAVLAVLAAIAVPNFQMAQIRTKLSRVRADQRDLAVAIEAYKVDWGIYPPDDPWMIWSTWPDCPCDGYSYHQKLGLLTSPEAYIAAVPLDPFGGVYNNLSSGDPPNYYSDRVSSKWYFYENYWHGFEYWVHGSIPSMIKVGDLDGYVTPVWQVVSGRTGPDLGIGPAVTRPRSSNPIARRGGDARCMCYDPTNGSRSIGVISNWGP